MKAKSKSNEVADKDLEKAAGGSVSKLIFDDGKVKYVANSSVNDRFGYDQAPVAWTDGYKGQPSNIFNNREDAEKYAIKRGWATDFHIFRQHVNKNYLPCYYCSWYNDIGPYFWTEEE